MQEIFDTAEPAGVSANGLDQAGGKSIDPPFGLGRSRRLREQSGCDLLVGWRIGRAEQTFRMGARRLAEMGCYEVSLGDTIGIEKTIAVVGGFVLLALPLCLVLRPTLRLSERPAST